MVALGWGAVSHERGTPVPRGTTLPRTPHDPREPQGTSFFIFLYIYIYIYTYSAVWRGTSLTDPPRRSTSSVIKPPFSIAFICTTIAGIRRDPARIKDLRKSVWSNSEGWSDGRLRRLMNSSVACLAMQNGNLEYERRRCGFNTKHQSTMVVQGLLEIQDTHRPRTLR